jgi:hypothetical protein
LAPDDVWVSGRDCVAETETSDDAEAAVDLEDNEVALEVGLEAEVDDETAMEGDGEAI